MGRGEGKADRAAPVVQHQRDLVQPEDLQQTHEVSDPNLERVVVRAGHRLRTTETALVGHEHPVPGLDQRLDGVAPQEGPGGVAVQQQDRAALTLVQQVQPGVVDRHVVPTPGERLGR